MGIDSSSPTQEADEKLTSVEDMIERYKANLQRLERIDISSLYPPEMKRKNWQLATNGPELDEFLSHIRPLDLSPTGGVNNGITAAFISEDGYIFAAPELPDNPNLRNLLLDMLATMKDLSPWSKVVGMKRAENVELFTTSKAAMYTIATNWIVYYPAVIRNIVNGLGEEKYSSVKKQGFIIEDVASLIHEAVHIENAQDLDMGGPHRVLVELAPTTCEYLAFPERNPKMTILIDKAFAILEGKPVENTLYAEALLMGLLILAQHDGALSGIDSNDSLVAELQTWKQHLEELDQDQMSTKRREYEQILLSDNDHIVAPLILALGDVYPTSLSALSLIDWLRNAPATYF